MSYFNENNLRRVTHAIYLFQFRDRKNVKYLLYTYNRAYNMQVLRQFYRNFARSRFTRNIALVTKIKSKYFFVQKLNANNALFFGFSQLFGELKRTFNAERFMALCEILRAHRILLIAFQL